MLLYAQMNRFIVNVNVAPQRFHCRTNCRLFAGHKRDRSKIRKPAPLRKLEAEIIDAGRGG